MHRRQGARTALTALRESSVRLAARVLAWNVPRGSTALNRRLAAKGASKAHSSLQLGDPLVRSAGLENSARLMQQRVARHADLVIIKVLSDR